MSPISSINYQYRVGGSLAYNHPTYVERQADKELLNALQAGKFCYIFNCRQMGKSSLRVRTLHQLQAEGMSCASLDVTSLGSELTIQQWYSGVITQLFLGFNLAGKINLKAWLKEREELPPVQKLGQFIEDVLLVHCRGEKIFIFIDEIDKVLSLKFSLDDFFSLIRFCYNQRAENPAYNRITFALFGVATPSDLIREKTQTSFNIGQAIELTGFREAETTPLEIGLKDIAEDAKTVVKELVYWSGGQPFLTQKICQLVFDKVAYISRGEESETVKNIVQNYVINNWESQDEPVHLKTIKDRLLRNEQRSGRLLGLYQQILQQGFIEADDSPEQVELRLSGLVVKREGKLQVYNPIYQAVFNTEWINKQLEKLRPYSESLTAWKGTNYQDNSRLLRGQALKDALGWAMGKSLSNEDYQFLSASQRLDKELEQKEAQLKIKAEQKANKILTEANQKATRRIQIGSAILIASLLGAFWAIGQANYATRRQQEAEMGTKIQRSSETALQQFQFNEIEGLLSGMQAGEALKDLVNSQRVLSNYPAKSPLINLEQILQQISEKNQIEGHKDTVYSVSFSPDQKEIATASRDGSVKIWNKQGQLLKTLLENQGTMFSVNFSPDGQYIATASKNDNVKVWDRQGKMLATLRGHKRAVYNVRFSPDSKMIATTSSDKTARIWDIKGRQLAVLIGHKAGVDDISFSPDGKKIATVSRDGSLKLWDIQGNLLGNFSQNKLSYYSVDFNGNGQEIAVGASDGSVIIFDLKGNIKMSLQGHQDFVNRVRFSPNQKWIATAGSDGIAKLWNLQGQELLTLKGHRESIYDIAWNVNSKKLATASEDGTVKLWDIDDKLEIKNKGLMKGLTGITFQGQMMARATKDGNIYLSDLGGNLKGKIDSDLEWIYSLSFSPDSQKIVAVSRGGIIKLWDLQGKLLAEWEAGGEDLYTVAFSADGEKLATGNRNGQVFIWKIKDNKPVKLAEFSAHKGAINHLTFSPDGQSLGTASQDKTAKVWDLNGHLKADLTGHQDEVYWIDFNPNNQKVATASKDGTVRLWNLQGKFLQELKEDLFPVEQVNFSNNGERLVSASRDGTVRLWDIQGNLRGEFKGEQNSIEGVTFTANDTEIVTVSGEGIVNRWQVEAELPRLERLLKQGCQWLEDYFVTHPEEKGKLKVCSKN